jgi:hypothetical protein
VWDGSARVCWELSIYSLGRRLGGLVNGWPVRVSITYIATQCGLCIFFL